MFFQENLWFQFINLLLGLTLITMIWSMIKQIMKTCQQIESVQYHASLGITGAIKGTSRLKLYNEIGLESLKFRWWFRKLCTFYKIKSTGLPSYFYDLIPKSSHMYNTCSVDVAMLCSRTIFKYSWNKLDLITQHFSPAA